MRACKRTEDRANERGRGHCLRDGPLRGTQHPPRSVKIDACTVPSPAGGGRNGAVRRNSRRRRSAGTRPSQASVVQRGQGARVHDAHVRAVQARRSQPAACLRARARLTGAGRIAAAAVACLRAARPPVAARIGRGHALAVLANRATGARCLALPGPRAVAALRRRPGAAGGARDAGPRAHAWPAAHVWARSRRLPGARPVARLRRHAGAPRGPGGAVPRAGA
jgi:hypothetical protein